jgi:single-strand DNA-binding protein
MNSTQLVGRLTADPVLRHTSNGTPVTDIRLAIDRRGDGTDFISVTVWARSAEVVAEHLARGRRVGVTGRLEQQQWTDKATGANRERLVVVAESFEFLDSPRRATPGQDASEPTDREVSEQPDPTPVSA